MMNEPTKHCEQLWTKSLFFTIEKLTKESEYFRKEMNQFLLEEVKTNLYKVVTFLRHPKRRSYNYIEVRVELLRRHFLGEKINLEFTIDDHIWFLNTFHFKIHPSFVLMTNEMFVECFRKLNELEDEFEWFEVMNPFVTLTVTSLDCRLLMLIAPHLKSELKIQFWSTLLSRFVENLSEGNYDSMEKLHPFLDECERLEVKFPLEHKEEICSFFII